MFALQIDDAYRQKVSDLVATALKHPITHAEMVAAAAAYAAGKMTGPMALNKAQTIHLPVSYDVTFTVEEHIPGVMFRHMSVSLVGPNARPGRGPHPVAVEEIMKAFGFQGGLKDVQVDTERLPDGRIAVGAIQPWDGDWKAAKAAQERART